MSSKEQLVVQVAPRSERGNGPSRRLRRSGRVPAVLYGHGAKATSLILEDLQVGKLLHHSGLIKLDFAGDTSISGILREVQRDPVSQKILHIDIQEVRADEIVTVTVEIQSVGDPAGIQAGGQLEQFMRHLQVKVQAVEMFDTLTVNVGAMQLGDVMHVKELPLPAGVIALGDPHAAVFQVRLPKLEEEAATEGEAVVAGEATGEPEVIAKGKKPEDGEEADGKKAAGKAESSEKGKEKK